MKFSNSIRALFISACCLFSIGCGRIFTSIYGIHAYDRNITQKDIDRQARKMGDPAFASATLSPRYYDHVSRIDSTRDRLRQALLQPLQLRYYGSDGRLQTMIANCHVGGFPNLKWDRWHITDSLPPKKNQYLDSTWTLQQDLQFINSPPPLTPKQQHVTVYWTYLMGRQSTRLKRQMDQLQEKHPHDLSIWYVNVDSLFMDRPDPSN